jgi:NADPH-dependent 2,4-dienoyl-CoA reductase/sulfur reductase-like enzyme
MRFENVIIGGGLAGGMVAQEYREQGGDGSVLLIAREAHPLGGPQPQQPVAPRGDLELQLLVVLEAGLEILFASVEGGHRCPIPCRVAPWASRYNITAACPG